MMKRVGVVTLPLWGNYGGMLQAYSLYTVCNSFPHIEAFLVVSEKGGKTALWRKLYRKVRFFVEKCFLLTWPLDNKAGVLDYELFRQSSDFRQKWFHCILPFAKQQINMTAYVVGSDQVWRKTYADIFHSLPFFFLDFAAKTQLERSVAYAASFGRDIWESEGDESKLCSNLLQQFKAVAVRETSGIKICQEELGVKAVQMPDPTLLASLEDYERVLNSEKTRIPKAPFFASYVLDGSPEVAQLLDDVGKNTGLYQQRLIPQTTARNSWDRFYCSVAQWLRYMRDCEVVVTDSFHGCVFSIIYNKSFVCLGNERRGSARFDTLFKTFGLEDRLVLSRDREEVLRVLNTPIDWARINAIHESERQRGLDFLRNNLYDGVPLGAHV